MSAASNPSHPGEPAIEVREPILDAQVDDDDHDDVRIIDAQAGDDDDVRIIEADDIEIVETEAQRQERTKLEEAPPRPKSNFGMMLIFFVVLFIMFDENLRNMTGNAVGFALNPTIGFGGGFPVATLMLAGVIMVTLSTVVRHFFVDHIKMARSQNLMRAFQKEFREARMAKDTPRVNELAKEQQKLLGLQQEMTSGQFKPMGVTMLVVIPMFAWLWTFVAAVDYHFFTTPWNMQVDLFTKEGIIFGSSVLPHWILLYSVLSIPFGQLVQKGLKVWSWRKRVDHIMSDHPDVHHSTD